MDSFYDNHNVAQNEEDIRKSISKGKKVRIMKKVTRIFTFFLCALLVLPCYGDVKINPVDKVVNTEVVIPGTKKDALEALKKANVEVIQVKEAKTDKFIVPNFVIKGAENPVEEGEMIKLTIAMDAKPPYLEHVGYRWTVLESNKKKNIVEWPDGTQVFWAAGLKKTGGKRFIVITHVDLLYVVRGEKNEIIDAAIRTPEPMVNEVVIGVSPTPEPQPNPNPDPDPTPKPDPDPVFPEGKFGAAKKVYDWVVKDKLINVPHDKLVVATKAVGDVHKSMTSIIRAGGGEPTAYKNLPATEGVATVLKDMTKKINKAISDSGGNPDDWNAIGTKIQDFTYDLYKSKKIKTVDDLADIFEEIGNGYQGVK